MCRERKRETTVPPPLTLIRCDTAAVSVMCVPLSVPPYKGTLNSVDKINICGAMHMGMSSVLHFILPVSVLVGLTAHVHINFDTL